MIRESELIINDDGSVFHLHLRPEELADNIILVGDPGRVDMVAEYLRDREFRRQSREFVSVTGKYGGKRLTVLSTGIGTDNIDIVMNELDALANIDFATREIRPEKKSLNILRIGTSGTLPEGLAYAAFENADGTYAFVLSNPTETTQRFAVEDGTHSYVAEVPAKALASYRWQK